VINVMYILKIIVRLQTGGICSPLGNLVNGCQEQV